MEGRDVSCFGSVAMFHVTVFAVLFVLLEALPIYDDDHPVIPTAHLPELFNAPPDYGLTTTTTTSTSTTSTTTSTTTSLPDIPATAFAPVFNDSTASDHEESPGKRDQQSEEGDDGLPTISDVADHTTHTTMHQIEEDESSPKSDEKLEPTGKEMTATEESIVDANETLPTPSPTESAHSQLTTMPTEITALIPTLASPDPPTISSSNMTIFLSIPRIPACFISNTRDEATKENSIQAFLEMLSIEPSDNEAAKDEDPSTLLLLSDSVACAFRSSAGCEGIGHNPQKCRSPFGRNFLRFVKV